MAISCIELVVFPVICFDTHLKSFRPVTTLGEKKGPVHGHAVTAASLTRLLIVNETEMETYHEIESQKFHQHGGRNRRRVIPGFRIAVRGD